MTIAFISNSELSDTASLTSYSVPKPACSVGDLIVMQIGTSERVRLNSALIASDGDIQFFTDVFTDGFTAPGIAFQYILDDGLIGSPRLFWWCGWKIADGSDAAGGTYTVNISSGGGTGADRCKADVVCYSGLTGLDTFAAQYFAVSGCTDNTITCPSVTATGGTPSGDFEIDCPLGSACYQGGVTLALTPVTGVPWLLCGAMQWYADIDLVAGPGLVLREASIMASLVKDAGAWAERTGSQVGPTLQGHFRVT